MRLFNLHDRLIADPSAVQRITRSLAVAQVSRTGVVMSLNAVYCEYLGVKDPAPLIGKLAKEVFGTSWPLIRGHFEQALAGNVVEYERLAHWGQLGSRRVRVRIVPIGIDTLTGQHTAVVVTVQDVDQDIRVKQTLEYQSQLLSLLQEFTPGVVSYQDAHRRFLFVNNGACAWLGKSREELIGKGVHQLDITPSNRLLPEDFSALRQGQPVSRDFLVSFPDGTQKHYQFHATPHMDAKGRYQGHLVSGVDIDSQVRARALLEQLTNVIEIPILQYNAQYVVEFANQEAARMWGRSASDMIGLSMEDLVEPDRVEPVRAMLLQAMNTSVPIVYERTLPHAVLGARRMRMTITPNCQPGLSPTAIVTFVDMQQDYDLRNELAERETRLQATLQALPGVLSFQNERREFEYVNENFLKVFNVTSEQVLGNPPGPFLGSSKLSMSADEHVEVIQGHSRVIERQVVNSAGNHWFEFRVEPRFDTEGKFRGHFAIGIDITDRKNAQLALAAKDRELWSAIDVQPSGIAYVRADGFVEYANSTYCRWFGITREQAFGKNVTEVLTPEVIAEGLPYWKMAIKGQNTQHERLFYLPDGTVRQHLISNAPHMDENGQVQGVFIVALDITDTKQAQAIAQRAERTLALHMENTPLAVIESDAQRRIRSWSVKAQELLGWTQDEVLGKTPEEIGLFEPLYLKAYQQHVEQLLDCEQASQSRHAVLQAHVLNRAGQPQRLEWHDSVLVDEQGKIQSILTLAQDITARIHAEQQLMYLATHDTLTGLPNRSLMQEWLERCLHQAQQKGQQVAALFLDLDGFKEVNDSLGHRQGDILLQRVAQQLRDFAREQDLVVRLSGDEFVLLVLDPTLEELTTLASNVVRAIAIPQNLNEHTVSVTASLGYAVFPHDTQEASTLVRYADLAMYQSKATGKNRVCRFTHELAQMAMARRTIENALGGALREKQLHVLYQPILDMRNGHIQGCEALVRWQREPGQQPLQPDEFLQYAESSGSIYDLTCFVLITACMQVVQWRQQQPDLVMSVNLSPSFIQTHDVAAEIYAVLQNTGCPPQALKVEVTESGLMTDLDLVREKLLAVRALGVGIALDDFGTGYSSLTYLRQFPVDTVKIDRSFVARLPDGEQDAAIVSAVLALARALNMQVVAEGVERPEQRAFLQAQGATAWQGYLFSKPVNVPDFERLLTQPNQQQPGNA